MDDKKHIHVSTDPHSPSTEERAPGGPRSWSWMKKHVFLMVITLASFLPDFGSAGGIPPLIPQAQEWMIPITTVQRSLVGNLFTIGAGGLFAIPLLRYFGRQPVLFYFLAVTFGTAVWCAAATSFDSYMAARILNGFFATVAQSGGLIWIQDMFEPEDYARKINIWASGILLSPWLAPAIASFVISRLTWRWAFWIFSILCGVALLSVIFILEETWFDPMSASLPKRGLLVRRIRQLIGIDQWQSRSRRSTFSAAFLPPLLVLTKIPVWMMMIYMFIAFAWAIAVNTTVGIFLAEGYGFGPRSSGFFYLSGVLGVIIGWVLGHWVHDLNESYFQRKSSRYVAPETRLFVIYPASLLMCVALIILGFGLQRHWHYVVLAVCYVAQIVGVIVVTVGANAYLLDAYPAAPGEVGASINCARLLGGFMASYIQLEWVAASGTATVFGAQAAIVFAAMVLVIVLHNFGEKIRMWQGPLTLTAGLNEV